jgi:putative mRNA 3-end processing factor
MKAALRCIRTIALGCILRRAHLYFAMLPSTAKFESWLKPDASGCCASRAASTSIRCAGGSGHHHARPLGPRAARPRRRARHGETIAVMKARLGETCAGSFQALGYGETLGSAARCAPGAGRPHPRQRAGGDRMQRRRAVVSGDYKRRADPTCAAFELVRCDLFVTEATFGLPVFRHEPDAREIGRLLASLHAFADRTHLIGAYGLGKTQRLIMLLRGAGYEKPIWLHGALKSMCDLYVSLGIDLGDVRLVADAPDKLPGEIVIAPPSALQDRWTRRLTDPVAAFASGWMRVRGRARQRGVELPLVISDHCDWPELIQTIAESGAEEVWVTHGREDALVHQIGLMGKRGRVLALVGWEDEEGE